MQKISYNVSTQATTQQQLNKIAVCYQQCFNTSLAAKLGVPYIKATLGFFFQSEKKFLFHIEHNNIVVGFCGGYIPAKYGDGSTSGMLQLGIKQALLGVAKKPWLIFQQEVVAMYPLIFKNVWQKITGSYTKKVNEKTAPQHFILSAGLVVIAVHEQYRGSNIFELLMKEFDKKVAQFHLQSAKLSVKQNNVRAIKAYEKYNWKIIESLGNTFILQKTY